MKNILHWKTLSSKTLLDNPQLSIQEDVVLLPNGQQTTYVMHQPTSTHSVIIIAQDDQGRLLLQREFSYPPNEIMWQLPGGAMNEGETPIEAGQRELAEESNYNLDVVEEIGYFYVNNRKSNRKQYIIAGSSPKKSYKDADYDEFIESKWVTLEKINKLIADGEITNINLLAALHIWENKKKIV